MYIRSLPRYSVQPGMQCALHLQIILYQYASSHYCLSLWTPILLILPNITQHATTNGLEQLSEGAVDADCPVCLI